jgi:peptidoglycan/xylan/chitin deacetylase (PgdA/CDA1 family)
MAPQRHSPGSRDSCLVVSYHYVRDASVTVFRHLRALHPAAFEKQITALERDSTIVDYDGFLAALAGERPLNGPSALLTFDDGLIDHYRTVFPQLVARGHRGIFFISPGSNAPAPRVMNVQKVQLLVAQLGERLWEEVDAALAVVGPGLATEATHDSLYRYDGAAVRRVKQLLNYTLPLEIADALLEKLFRSSIGDEAEIARELYLTPAMIREMAHAGMTFGFHTRDHRVLSRLPLDEQRAQLEDGVQWIQGLTGQASVPFCYPHGHAHAYTQDTVRLVRECGYSMAFTAVRGTSLPSTDQRFEVPRLDTRDVPSPEIDVHTAATNAPPPDNHAWSAGGR